MMTLTQMQDLCLTWLDDPNAGYFTRPILTVWLNNAQQELQKRLLLAGQNWYLRCQQTSIVTNQNLYALPSDFREVHRLEVVINGTFPNETKSSVAPITFNQQDLLPDTTGIPECYVLKKNAIQIFPVPDGTAQYLRMNYSYRVSDMVNGTDVADAPEQYHEFLPVMATLDGALRDKGDMSGILEKKRFYEEMLKSDSQMRTVDQPRSVVITQQDGFGRLF